MKGLVKLIPLLSDKPCIIDNFFSEEELLKIRNFILKHKNDFHCGKVISPFDGPIYNFDVKRNSVYFDDQIELKDIYLKIKNQTLNEIKKYIKTNSKVFEEEFNMLNFERGHFSQYSNGYYDYHLDKTQTGLTIISPLFFGQKIFSGGDFFYKINGVEEKITFRNNQLIIFKSNTPHKISLVTPVDNNFISSRFSLQIWPTFQEEAQSELSIKDETQFMHNRNSLMNKLLNYQNENLKHEEREFLEKYININFKGVFNYLYYNYYQEFPEANLKINNEKKEITICYEFKEMKLFYKIKDKQISYNIQIEDHVMLLNSADSTLKILEKVRNEYK